MSPVAESEEKQRQRPQAGHHRRRDEALSPAVTASGSPHPRPCRPRRGEEVALSGGKGRGGSRVLHRESGPIPSSFPFFTSFSPTRVRRGINTQLLRGMLSVRAGVGARRRENKVAIEE